MTASTPAIEEIAQADPSGLAAIAGPHLKLIDSYYNNVLQQSRRSFMWAIVGFIGVFALIAVAILFLIFRLSGESSYLAAIITALGSVPSALLSGYLLNLHKNAQAGAAASQVHLDRIQRFFIANSASENLKEASKDSTREALIKKLGDL
jgi:Cyanobacterial TRADD-N associated 2-Transmembrane domain